MAAIEAQVLTRLLNGGVEAFLEAQRSGLKEHHFKDPEKREIFKFINQFWHHPATAKTLPTVSRIRKRWPSFLPTAEGPGIDGRTPDEIFKGHISELKLAAFESDMRGMAEFLTELIDEDPASALTTIKNAIYEIESRLESRSDQGMGLREIAELAKTQYEGAQSGAIYGIPWPWKCLTDDTLGKRKGDFIVLYGRMKSMKTWILLYCAAFDFLVNKRRVLVWSREMSKEKLGLRMATLLAKVDYQLFKAGILPPRLQERVFRTLAELGKQKTKEDMREGAEKGLKDIILLAGREAPRSLDDLRNWVKEFAPDIIYLDSFYHMDSVRSVSVTQRWQRVAALAEDVKAFAEDEGIPIVAVHQANRSGEKTYGNTLADVADADVIAREADLIIRVLVHPRLVELREDDYELEYERIIRDQRKAIARPRIPRGAPIINTGKADLRALDQQTLEKLGEKLNSEQGRIGAEMALVMGGNREGTLPAFTLRVIPGYCFEILSDNPSMKDISTWVKEDNEREENAAPRKTIGKTGLTASDYAESLADIQETVTHTGSRRPDSKAVPPKN